jgi:transcription-repair coupling factor (superfamily II helicase)
MGMDDTPEYHVNQSRVDSVKNPRQNVERNRVSAEQPEFKPVKEHSGWSEVRGCRIRDGFQQFKGTEFLNPIQVVVIVEPEICGTVEAKREEEKRSYTQERNVPKVSGPRSHATIVHERKSPGHRIEAASVGMLRISSALSAAELR